MTNRRRRLVVRLAMLLSLGPLSMARGQSAASTTPVALWPADSLAIVQASRAWMQALRRRDRAALDSLMTPEWALAAPGADGPPLPKARWIDNSLTILETDSAAYPVLHARRLGPDVAITSARLYWKARLRGVPIPRAYDVTDVWVRRDGRWQVAARDGDLAGGPLIAMAFTLGAGLVALAWLIVAWMRRRRRRSATREQRPLSVAGAA
jgi:ketosteroid isomerase-like protein